MLERAHTPHLTIALAERRMAAPVVSNNCGTGCHGAFDEADQRLGASIWHHREADPPGVTPVLSLVKAAGTLALSDFDGAPATSTMSWTARPLPRVRPPIQV